MPLEHCPQDLNGALLALTFLTSSWTSLGSHVLRWAFIASGPLPPRHERGSPGTRVLHLVLDFLGLSCSSSGNLKVDRQVQFKLVTLETPCGPLALRGLKAWVDNTTDAAELLISRAVME
ncbi:hypothetical protein AC1031_000526 [Aphanomyces cochlioides]|nr:hypothetical protein AC1031_000526 [Aphanomyces cochlioides]